MAEAETFTNVSDVFWIQSVQEALELVQLHLSYTELRALPVQLFLQGLCVLPHLTQYLDLQLQLLSKMFLFCF